MYGSLNDNNDNNNNNNHHGKDLWTEEINGTSRACRNQLVFIFLLITTFVICIIFSLYPIKERLPNKIQEIDPTSCVTHICLYDDNLINFENENVQISLLQNHPSTITDSTNYAFINFEQFELYPSSLTVTHPDGVIITMPLKAYKTNGLYYFQDDELNVDQLQNRFLISINFETHLVEGFVACRGQKFELHSINDPQFYLLIEKNWIQDDVYHNMDWCGIFDINTQYQQINNDNNNNDINDNDINDNDINYNQDIVQWFGSKNTITNHVGLGSLIINNDASNNENGFIVEPLCSGLSQYDGNIYCLYPSSHSWQQFEQLLFYKYNDIESLWTEMIDNGLNLADSTINLPKSMCIVEDNEIYSFSVNPIDSTINIYSFTTYWRLHHYEPIIGGDIDKVEIKSIFVNDILYFSINEYDPIGIYTVFHYTNDIFSIFDTHQKTEIAIYSHCLTSFNKQLLTFYIDYGHNIFAYYNDKIYNLQFNIAVDIDINQFECVSTQNGNILSWRYQTNVYYLQLSPTDFTDILLYTKLPWNLELSSANIFQLISLKNAISNYKTVSVFYSNDIITNYLLNVESVTMDISSIIDLSNILYAINNDYESMLKLQSISMYDDDQEIDEFTSLYQGESDINVLLVDVMSDNEEVGYSQCNQYEDQSFAVVQFTAF